MQSLTRRDMVRGATLAVAGAALAAPAAVAVATGARSADPQGTGHHGAGTAHAEARTAKARAADVPEPFDEVYLGRHIEGWPAEEGDGGHHQSQAAPQDPVEFVVRVDDDELHVMRNADGSWISVVNHYETHRTPRDAARAAVRELHGASLVPVTV
ncbi:tyrosinase cofactor [Streptomyces sp. NPDC127084]|uniref:apotyrosinase chaperone MelC1 n=1 Tax=Streptomyces sp. NPDC127084 TaxID=3347133 RepID=UPI00364AF00D